MKPAALLFLLIAIGCNKGFRVQRTNIDQNTLSSECLEIKELINSQYKINRKSHCHYDNGIQRKLAQEYEPCLKSMNRAQIEMLLGKPDGIQENFYYYFFDEKCTNESRRSQGYLRLGFKTDTDKVFFVESGIRVSG